MKLGLTLKDGPPAIDENKSTRVAIMEIIQAEGCMDDSFNHLVDSKFDDALASIDAAEGFLQGARAAIQRARAERIDRKTQN